MNVTGDFPEKLAPLFEPHRYKVLYGGRSAAKSWSVARALLLLGTGAIPGYQRPLRILCGREIQNSIAESVHQLLCDQIGELGLSGFYRATTTEIRGRNGTQFFYAGLRHNIANIRSKEGIDIAWIEEAVNTSKASWNQLIPTIRKDGSEIWLTFNPELDTDETYKRFVLNPPPGAWVQKVNWSDNPWFRDVVRAEMEHLKETDYDEYLTVWEGHCRLAVEGSIFANELREAKKEERITRVMWDKGTPVHTVWDLGKSDLTAIWFVQAIASEYRVIDYYENSGQDIPHYLKTLQEKPYVYGVTWLPHDARHDRLGMPKTIEGQIREVMKDVRVLERSPSKATMINAARTVFPRCFFDEEKTSDGIQALRHWQFKVDPVTGNRSKEPFHNWASNGAEAFCYLALAVQQPKAPQKIKIDLPLPLPNQPNAWMA